MIIACGKFQGYQGHNVQGSFVTFLDGNSTYLKTSPDFYLDGSPLPCMVFSQYNTFFPYEAKSHCFHEFSHNAMNQDGSITGIHEILIPRRFNIKEYSYIFLCCFEVFPVLIGKAFLNLKAMAHKLDTNKKR